MPERVVVSFRGAVPPQAGPGPSYLERALDFKQRAEALGATLCSWSAQTFSFDFAPDELEEAVSLAVLVTEDKGAPPDLRFGAGISIGMLESVGQGRSMMVLSWGRPLIIAVALARVAHPGEVLLDPDLPALRSGDLLTLKTRISADHGVRIRGAVLDIAQPWRKLAASNVARLVEPPLVGQKEALQDLALAAGSVGIVQADRGAGGSRMLAEILKRLAPNRSLWIAPSGVSREPLGAIRHALARSSALHGTPPLVTHLRNVLDRLLVGDGADPWSAAELIDAWLASTDGGASGVLVVDDANEVDEMSLEAVANAIHVRGGFRMLVRIGATADPPAALNSLPRAFSLVISPLAARDALHVASAFADWSISEEAVARWGKRGGTLPLGIREALLEGLTSGELSWQADVATPRRRVSGKGKAQTPRAWMLRRLRYLTKAESAVLTALAVLGGDASAVMIDGLVESAVPEKIRTADVEEALLLSGWVSRPEPSWLKLRSRTAGEAILGRIDASEQPKWHAAAVATLAQHGGSLARADAAWHASQANDPSRAAQFAKEAAKAARRAALDHAAEELVKFARSQAAESPDAIAEDVDASYPSAPPTQPASAPLEPARGRFDTMRNTAVLSLLPPAASVGPSVPLEVLGAIETVETPRLVDFAARALVHGEIDTLEVLVAELRTRGKHPTLVERMAAFISLGRGAKLEALGKLRERSLVDQPPSNRAAALLAYGVALASVGRTETAFLETMDALARARQAADKRAEHACARFLARLSSAAGSHDAAAVWVKVATSAAAASRGS